ncbi:hypothetical protein [Helicobacter rodentium]|uniref:hypothetical protein n=1 Tax=Helicobacter rodentium TaxID=59617 RepID=UPI0025583BAD|nr:hypothetical protein [Helicobacter rodentium]
MIYIIRRGDLLFCHCERVKRTKQSIILHKVIFTMESLKKCILIDCHDFLRSLAMTQIAKL